VSWKKGQTALLTALLAGPVYERVLHLPLSWPPALATPATLAGVLGLLVAAVPYLQAKSALGDRMRIEPEPSETGSLVATGVFSRLRHPMYAAIILGSMSWVLIWNSTLGAPVEALVCVFFVAKLRHEERLLARKYPDYLEYRKQVPALLPRFRGTFRRR
jgi:protein-S-isoprenylcysteine O-methyltransferase Ste14